MPVLHVHFVDDKDIHVPNADGRAVGGVPLPFDVKFSTGKTGVVHFDLGVTGGSVALFVDVTTREGVKASTWIHDAADPIFRPDIQYIFKIPGAKGDWWAEFLAKLEAEWAEHKTEIVVGGFLVGLAGALLAARSVKSREAKRQETMMMMAMGRAPPEVATAHLENGTKVLKQAAVRAAKPMKILKAKFRKVSK